MDPFLFVIALGLMMMAGLGALTLLSPQRFDSGVEVIALAFLLGAACVSLASFVLGLAVAGVSLRLLLAVGCLALGGVAWWRRPQAGPVRWLKGFPQRWLLLGAAIITGQAAFLFWQSWGSPLGWDGLLVWDIKARLACLNGGVMPADYFTDPTRMWSNPQHTPYLPLVAGWIYDWLGRCDQQWIKALFPMYYVAGAGLLLGAGFRWARQPWQAIVAVLLLFSVPAVWSGNGSATSGYVDFPLGVYYLAAVVAIVDYLLTGSMGDFRLAIALTAVLPWLKRDGVGAMVIALALLLLATLAHRRLRLTTSAVILLPALLVFGGWKLFLAWLGAGLQSSDTLPVTLSSLTSNLGRLADILPAYGRELGRRSHWGILWGAVLLVLPWLGWPKPRPTAVVLVLATAAPLVLFPLVFIFSAWSDYMLHMSTTVDRLVLQVAPVGVLLVTLAPPLARPAQVEKKHSEAGSLERMALSNLAEATEALRQ